MPDHAASRLENPPRRRWLGLLDRGIMRGHPVVRSIDLPADLPNRIVIKIQGLEFTHPGASRAALRGVDLTVRRGSLFGLLGPNGAGKTTLLSLLCGLRRPRPGQILVDGQDMASRSQRLRPQLALVPQEYAFYPVLSVSENLDFFAGIAGLRGAQAASRIAEAVAVTGLQEVLSMPAQHGSGGVKRRLNIAIGLLNNPRLLFLDEPTVGIDPQSRHFILDAIRTINRAGTTIVYTSHYMEEVQALCDEIAIIDHGEVLLQGPLAGLLQATGATEFEVWLAAPLDPSQQQVLQGEGARLDGDRLWLSGELYAVVRRLEELQVAVAAVYRGSRNLEDLFIQLTHRSLRD